MNIESLVKLAIQQFGGGSAGMVGGILQMLMQQFMNQNEGGLAGFLDMFKKAGLGDAVSGWLGGASTAALSADQVKAALGGGGLLSKLGGLPGMSASSLLPMLGFLVPKLIGVLTPGGNMPTAAGLMQHMDALKGLPSFGGLTSMASGAAAEAAESSSKWLVPLLAGLALIGAIVYFTSGTASAPVEKTAVAVAETKTAVADAAKTAAGGLGAFFSRKLPGGLELNIPELGIENNVVKFIEDATKPVDKTTWFNFDRLLFDTGKATLQASSQEQLTNITSIMAAYPKVKIKLGGYTDNTGAEEANMKLSADRAANVVAELVKLGVPAARMASDGYGDQFPVGDNATEEGRAQNRRIALRVTEK